MFGKKISPMVLISHIALFVLVEIVFVLIVFRELPETNLYTKIGVAHTLYRIVVLLCSLWREQSRTVVARSLALWTPMVFHLLIHIWVGVITLEEHGHEPGHEHHEGELWWVILGTLVAGVMVYYGEKLIHRNRHCVTHHGAVHQECLEGHHEDCEKKH